MKGVVVATSKVTHLTVSLGWFSHVDSSKLLVDMSAQRSQY